MKNLLLIMLVGFVTMAFDGPPQQLKSKDKVRHFTTKDVYGQKLSLKKELKNNDKVLLVFLRHAWCPVCNNRTHELKERYSLLKDKGIEVVVIYQSNPETLLGFAKDYDLPFRVVSDPDEKLYDLYQMEKNKQKMLNDFATNDKTKQLMQKGSILYGKNKYTKYKKTADDKSKFYIPGDFLIDKNGKVDLVYYGAYLGDHLDLEEVLSYSNKKTSGAGPKVESYRQDTNVRF